MMRLLGLLVTLGFVTGQATAATLAEVQSRGSLRACVSLIDRNLVRAVPDGCIKDCEYKGLVVDQVEIFSNTLDNVTLELVGVNWQDQFKNDAGVVVESESYEPTLLANNSCDIYASNLAILDWRLSKMAIVPLFENRMMVVIHQQSSDVINTVDDLAGKSAVVELESSFHSWLRDQNATRYKDNPIKIIPADDENVLDLIASRSVDFTLTDADMAVFSMRDHPAELAIAFAVGEAQQLGWGLSRHSTKLNSAVASFFARQRADSRSALNKAWRAYLDLSIIEFEQLVRSLPSNK